MLDLKDTLVIFEEFLFGLFVNLTEGTSVEVSDWKKLLLCGVQNGEGVEGNVVVCVASVSQRRRVAAAVFTSSTRMHCVDWDVDSVTTTDYNAALPSRYVMVKLQLNPRGIKQNIIFI